MTKVCEKCKPDKPELHEGVITNSTGERCREQYTAIQACMKAHRGNISSCIDVWDSFKSCHRSATEERKAQNS
jgi:hypothetical protein